MSQLCHCRPHHPSCKLTSPLIPQTATRSSASLWLCHIHNQVNESLGKEEFDCSSVEGLYDCGCKDDPPAGEEAKTMDERRTDPLTGLELFGG